MHFLPNPLIIPVGIIIGILVSAPVGPVNVLCIQRAIERGFGAVHGAILVAAASFCLGALVLMLVLVGHASALPTTAWASSMIRSR